MIWNRTFLDFSIKERLVFKRDVVSLISQWISSQINNLKIFSLVLVWCYLIVSTILLLWRFFFQEILRKHKSCLISCFAFTYGNIGSLVSKVGTQNIWPKSSMLKEKYCTLSIDIVPSHQNLGIILEIKCFKIWSYQKFDRKSVLMKLLNKKNLKALDTFWQRKLTLNVRFWHLPITPVLQNSIIFLHYSWFLVKILFISIPWKFHNRY